jgi:hypothetical protein
VKFITTLENLERQIIQIIATDRIDKPISSMSGKLKRAKSKLAKAVELDGGSFEGSRVYAYVEETDLMKARGMKNGIEAFSNEHPKYGTILKGYIEEERAKTETHLNFGMYEGCRLSSNDYMGVMTGLGFSEGVAEGLYPELMNISYGLARKREETGRSILIGN